MKKYLHEIWMGLAITIILVLSIIAKTELIQIIASVCGVIYVLCVAKEQRIGQIFGLVNTAIYAYLMFSDKVYGSAIYNGLYCIPMLIYTYFNWGRGDKKLKITSFKVTTKLYIILFSIIAIVIYYIFGLKVGINYPLADAISIIFGVLGMYAISKKKIDQWYFFILVNIANISMWIIKTIENPANISMVIMWLVYVINNIYGLVTWNKSIKEYSK